MRKRLAIIIIVVALACCASGCARFKKFFEGATLSYGVYVGDTQVVGGTKVIE